MKRTRILVTKWAYKEKRCKNGQQTIDHESSSHIGITLSSLLLRTLKNETYTHTRIHKESARAMLSPALLCLLLKPLFRRGEKKTFIATILIEIWVREKETHTEHAHNNKNSDENPTHEKWHQVIQSMRAEEEVVQMRHVKDQCEFSFVTCIIARALFSAGQLHV